MSIIEIITIISALSGIIGTPTALISVYILWKKAPVEIGEKSASASKMISDSAVSMVGPLKLRIDDLEKDLAQACESYDKLRIDHTSLKDSYAAAELERLKLAGQVNRMQADLEQERAQGAELRKLYAQMQTQYSDMQIKNTRLEKYIKRLAYQVRSLDGIPVEMDKLEKGSATT